jgi:CPA2 family monovalent cation:H+ antiporter-2
MGPLYELGANEVIPEEFETSVEIFSRVLGKYLQPKEEIERFVAKIRSEGYEMFRSISKEATSCLDIAHCLPDVEMKSFRVSEGAPILDLSLAQTEMRKKFGVNVLAIRRDSDLIYNPSPDTRFQKNDLVVLMGQPEGV